MKFVVFFVVTLFCMYQHVTCNQQTDDPNRPFWATRGRRSGPIRGTIKTDDDSASQRWQDDDGQDGLDSLQRKREQATSLLASFLNALSSYDGEVIRKRGDGKTIDPTNPFWAARG